MVNGDMAVEGVSPTEVVAARPAEIAVVLTNLVAVSIVVTAVAVSIVVTAMAVSIVVTAMAPVRGVSLVGSVMLVRSGEVVAVFSVPAVAVMRGASPRPAGCNQQHCRRSNNG